jgi:hypothetical protein
MPIQLPRVGTGIVLRDLTEAAYASRIESWDRERITVVKPMGVPAAFPYPLGTPFDVLWSSQSGVHVLPVELATTRSEGQVLLWELKPVAEPWVEQRREFVRVPVFGRVVLTTDTADDPDQVPLTLQGYLVEVSEAALQCSVWAGPDDPLLTAGSRVVAEFTVRGAGFDRHGVIHGARRGAEDNEMTVIVLFDQSDAEARVLRREVYAAQLDLRQVLQKAPR